MGISNQNLLTLPRPLLSAQIFSLMGFYAAAESPARDSAGNRN